MGRITSTVGLLSGIPIQETVDKLIALQAEPRDRLRAATDRLRQQQQAVAELTAKLLAVQISARQLNSESAFSRVAATSSNAELVSVATTGSVPLGSYQFTPLRQAQAQQLLSSGFASNTAPLGAGTITFRHGQAIDQGIDLSQLNDGRGVQRGKIRITDRSGAAAEIDLSQAVTIDDVLTAINNNGAIDVRATAHGDALRLTDDTGQTTANLRVQEVGSGRTAADLGLAGINVAANVATGSDLLRITESLSLDILNDGRGVRIDDHLPEFSVSLRDGTTVEVDLHRPLSPAGQATATTTAARGESAKLTFTATTAGADFDDVRIVFVNDDAVNVGEERVAFDDADANDKQLVFTIDAGNTTAADVLAALNREPEVAAIFSAELDAGSNGTGIIDVRDTAATSGGAPQVLDELTIGDVLEQINAAAPDRLEARIAADGQRLELVDSSTSSGGQFRVTALFGQGTASDLGLTSSATGGTITGARLLGGLTAPLLSSLGGRQGLGDLGLVTIINRRGETNDVDLYGAETLDDLLQTINDAGIGVTARVNDARTGILLEDTTGATDSNLIVADGDFSFTATQLQITADVAAARVDSGDLHRRVVSESTRLSALNLGRGVNLGRIRITDSSGGISTLDLRQGSYETLGDVIDGINALGVRVAARINDHGDGIVLVDEAGGNQAIKVEDLVGNTARDLRLNRTARQIDISGTPTYVLDGTATTTITLDADDRLLDLAAKLNAANAGLSATIVNDGSAATPYRLALAGTETGRDATFLFDPSGLGFTLEETAAARDALVTFGSGGQTTGILATSRTNRFDNLVDGLTVEINGTATAAVTINVAASSDNVISSVKLLVNAYNEVRDKLASFTSFDTNTFRTGLLFGSAEALRIDADLSRVVSAQFAGLGSLQTLQSIGITLDDKGKLTLDEAKLKSTYDDHRQDLEDLFADDSRGLAARLDQALESLVGVGRSVLVTRSSTLGDKIARSSERVAFLTERLDRQRQLLLADFARMENAIAKVQDNLQALNALQIIQPLSAGRG